MKAQLILDLWTPLSYKRRFEEGSGPTQAPRWIGDHARRLEAYKLFAAFRDNVSRFYLETQDAAKRNQRRELGDANLIVETIVDAILGDDVTIAVEGAGNEDEPDEGADTLQEWIHEWEDAERPLLSIIEAEEDAVTLGDGVYVVGLDTKKNRPTVMCYDPGFYFPVYDDEGNGYDFPTTVHVAWEYEKETRLGGKQNFVRRITWRLVEVPAYSLPWNTEPATLTCLWTDASYAVKATKTVNDIEFGSATYHTTPDGQDIHNLDLRIDFIPVIHLPNTIARKEHYGRSSLTYILQLLDELQSADTDLALSARITGFPPIATKGAVTTADDGKTILSYGPGTVFQGEVTAVDTSRSLDALLKYVEHIMRRISTNTRLPESILGRTTGESQASGANGFASGKDRELSFAPLKNMVRKMRLSREEKYPLLFKFVCRFAMQANLIPANTALPKVTLEFGPFLPSDQDAEIERIRNLFKDKLISRLTAIKMLIAAGLEIADAEEEVTAIEHEDFEGAKQLADATGSDELAGDYLDLEIPEPPPLPPGAIPGPGGVVPPGAQPRPVIPPQA